MRVYFAALDEGEAAFRQRGELQGVLAVREERNRIKPQPDANIGTVSPLPDQVARLRAAYEERRHAVAVEEAKAVKALANRSV